MKLSHTTRVTVRKALKALQTIDHDAEEINDDNQQNTIEYREMRIVRKTGFPNRSALEGFAIKHHLL